MVESHISDERVELLRQQVQQLQEKIDSMQQPLAHGVTSEHLQNILDSYGLGSVSAENAFAGTKSATNLKMKEGLLGAYLFARLNKKEDLSITREIIESRDAISRYVELNPIDEAQLRNGFERYIQARDPKGYPVLLVYDGGGNVKTQPMNPTHPSEVEFEGSISNQQLKIVLVPEQRMDEVRKMLAKENIGADVMPAEILEIF